MRAALHDAMARLQDAGTLTYTMGRVKIRDRKALEGHACECYATITFEFDRLLGTHWHPSSQRAPLEGLQTSERGITALGDGVGARGNERSDNAEANEPQEAD